MGGVRDRSEVGIGAGRRQRRFGLLRLHPPAARSAWMLPAQPSRLIGRAEELAAARALLQHEDVRLLTLTGPAGVGKTRLAVALAERLAPRYPDGVGFVDLASMTDARQVVPTIARRLGAPPAAGRPAIQALQDFLASRRALLVLDNFEHVLDAAPRLSQILEACPSFVLVVTSRAPLHLRWEHVLSVPPLALPDPRHPPPLAALARIPAISLFVERARAARPAFALTAENAPTVSELCMRLDGLPLAIELAARQASASSPEAIVQRLARAFGDPPVREAELLAPSGAHARHLRDLPARQQTLDAAIAWSYELLTTDEQALFRRLTVFEGGFTLDGAHAIGRGALIHVSPALEALADSSLLVRDQPPGQGAPRYRLLETIRQYGLDRLAAAGETATARTAHLRWCLQFVETADRALRSGGEPEWLPRLDVEQENVRVALAWSGEDGDLQAFARLVAALWWYWHLRGVTGETNHLLERALAIEAVPPAVRVMLLNGAALFSYDRGEYGRAEVLATEALAVCQQEGDAWGAAFAQSSLGFVAYFRGEYERADALLRAGLTLARATHDPVVVARALNNLGVLALARGQLGEVRALFEESLALWRQLRSDGPTALALLFLGRAAHEQGDQERARLLLDESVAISRRTGYARAAGPALYLLGRVARAEGHEGRAATCFQESLAIRREQGDRRGIAECFEGLASAADATRHPSNAARLLGAADALRAAIGAPLPQHAAPARTQTEAGLRRRLGARYDDLQAEGATMPLDAALRFALGDRAPDAPERPRPSANRPSSVAADRGDPDPSPTLLSPRERQVSELVARGLSNREIAAALVVAEGSATNHVKRILAKLGFRSRAQIAVWAARHGPLE